MNSDDLSLFAQVLKAGSVSRAALDAGLDLLLHEAVRLVAPIDCPLPGDTIAVGDLGRIPLILPSTHHGLRLLVEELAERHKSRLQISLECDGSISLMKSLVMENTGCTALPLAAVMDEVSGTGAPFNFSFGAVKEKARA